MDRRRNVFQELQEPSAFLRSNLPQRDFPGFWAYTSAEWALDGLMERGLMGARWQWPTLLQHAIVVRWAVQITLAPLQLEPGMFIQVEMELHTASLRVSIEMEPEAGSGNHS
jgi:hypothetical protein